MKYVPYPNVLVNHKNWGFYYTFKTNLDKVLEFLPECKGMFGLDEVKLIENRVNEIKKWIEEAQKGLKWNIRSLIGTKIKWYQDVEEVVRST